MSGTTSILNNYLPVARRIREFINLSCIPAWPAGRLSGMSPGEQSFVQLEGETCEARLRAFVRESGEKECT